MRINRNYGKNILFDGKSSSGKDTLYRGLRIEFPQLKPVVLYTTRPMREGEQDGVDYYFIDDDKVELLKSQQKIIEIREYNTIYGIWKYMTVDDGNIDIKSENYLMIGTLESYAKIREYFGEKNLVPLYIHVEDGERTYQSCKKGTDAEFSEICGALQEIFGGRKRFFARKLKAAGIEHYFNNISRNKCIKKLADYINKLIE